MVFVRNLIEIEGEREREKKIKKRNILRRPKKETNKTKKRQEQTHLKKNFYHHICAHYNLDTQRKKI